MPDSNIVPDKIPVLSDHSYVAVNFEFSPPGSSKGHAINVGSWNLQDKGHSQQSNRGPIKFSNNPFNADETEENYKARKQAQFKEIEKKIIQGEHVILMQEPDCFTRHDELGQELTRNFKAMLNLHNYELVLTEMPRPPLSQQPLALIYSKDELQVVEKVHLFPTPLANGMQRYRGYQVVFNHLKSNLHVAIANLHLAYGVDYNQAISEHLNSVSKDGTLIIMGGDTNSPPDPSNKSSFCDPEIATNFCRVMTDRNEWKLTTEHVLSDEPYTSVQKAYDRFFGAAPGGYHFKAEITSRSEQVFIDPETGQAEFCPALLPGGHSAYDPNTPPPNENVMSNPYSFFSHYSIGPAVPKSLFEFLNRIEKCRSEEELNDEIKKIIATPEYKMIIENRDINQDATMLFETGCDFKRRALLIQVGNVTNP